MPSTERRRGQRGVSLIEAVVASALLGIAVVVGITAWDTAANGAKAAARHAWASCVGRTEMEAVLATSGVSYPPAYPNVTIQVAAPEGVTDGSLQEVTVTVTDPDTGANVYTVSALKAPKLGGYEALNPSAVGGQITRGCPPP